MYEEEYDYDAHRQYEDDMYQSDNTDASGEKVDSDIEDTLLSHVYYTPKSQKSTPVQGAVSAERNAPEATPSKIGNPISRVISGGETDSDSDEQSHSSSDRESDTKYSLSKRSKKTEPSLDRDSSAESDSSLDWDESNLEDEKNKELTTQTEPISLKSPPKEETNGASVLNSTPIQHTEPLLVTQVITPSKNMVPEPQPESSQVSDDEYEYLEDADIKGKNRYFMEPDSGKKGQVCYICKEPGHLARDCTVLKCFICGEEGHTSRDCLFTSEICHNCNKRGHRARDCPEPRSFRVKECKRCESRHHHSEECPLIWRQYVIANPNASKIKSDRMFCYNCGDCGHFGDQCSRTKMDQNSSVDSSAFGNSNSSYRNSRNRSDEDRRPAKRYRADFHDDYRHRYDDRDYNRDYNRNYSREKNYKRDRQYDHDNGRRRESSYTPRDKYRNRGSDYRQSPSYKKSSPSYRNDKKRRR